MSAKAVFSRSFLSTMTKIAVLICSRLLLTTAEFSIPAALRLSCLSQYYKSSAMKNSQVWSHDFSWVSSTLSKSMTACWGYGILRKCPLVVLFFVALLIGSDGFK